MHAKFLTVFLVTTPITHNILLTINYLLDDKIVNNSIYLLFSPLLQEMLTLPVVL